MYIYIYIYIIAFCGLAIFDDEICINSDHEIL